MKEEKVYMNIETGDVDIYAGWWYLNDRGQEVNAVDLEEVVEVENVNGEWLEV